MNSQLEQAVKERTQQLNSSVDKLVKEVNARREAEAGLQAIRQSLAERVAEQSRQLTALYEIILLSSGPLKAREIISQYLGNIVHGLAGDAAIVFERDVNSGIYHLIVCLNISDRQQESVRTLPQSYLPEGEFTYISANLIGDARIPEVFQLDGFRSILMAPIQWNHSVIGLLGIYWQTSIHLPVEEIALFLAIADQLGLVMENSRLRVRIEETAVIKERRRLARELHDSVTQSIHSLVLSADTARNRLKNNQYGRLEKSLEHMATSARQALKDMRLLLYELRLVNLEDIKLAEALQAWAELVEQRAGIGANLSIDENIVWPPDWQGEVYAIIMEAMNNSLKYARASSIHVTVSDTSSGIGICIEDDGIGFDMQSGNHGGHGLTGMYERAERLDAEMEIFSQPGQGTRIYIQAAYPGVN